MNLYEEAVQIMEEGQYREVLACSKRARIKSAQMDVGYLTEAFDIAEKAVGERARIDANIDINRSAASVDKSMSILLRSRWPRLCLVSQTDYYGKVNPDRKKIESLIQDGIALYLEVLKAEVAQDAREQGR